MKAVSVFLLVVGLFAPVSAQWEFGVVCSTDVPFATGPNNSHKLAFRSEMLYPQRDTITLVFQSSESIYYCLSGNGVNVWSRPVALYPGADPAIALGRDGDRHLVWQMLDTLGRLNIFYRNLEFRMMPVNVSGADGNCFHPDVFGDSAGVAHIVWEEGEASPQIWYRQANERGVIGDRFRVSTDSLAACRFPAIEQFNNGIGVVWQEVDTTESLPYKIMRRRQVGGVWQTEEVLAEQSKPLSHPAVDFSGGNEGFSGGWEKVVNGNYEVEFYGGNGGGYPTGGVSTKPVLSTIGDVWSYLFWEEDSSGRKDIFTHFYYFMTGWSSPGSVRNIFQIDEQVYAPNCLGALLVWTQGDTAPYQVMWAFFGYPIGVEEKIKDAAKLVRGIFNGKVYYADRKMHLYDASGRRVMELKPGANDICRVKAGVYFVQEVAEIGDKSNGFVKIIITR